MIFTRENCKSVTAPSAKKLVLDLSRTKQSFANLVAEDGSFVQVAGGPGLFLLERRELSGSHSRAYLSPFTRTEQCCSPAQATSIRHKMNGSC